MLFSLRRRCPRCREGQLFKPWSVTPVSACAVCGAALSENDVGDGAAVFLIFLLGFTLIPLAWMCEVIFAPPLWGHVIVWSCVGLGMVALLLPALKAYIMLLEYRHRPQNWQ